MCAKLWNVIGEKMEVYKYLCMRLEEPSTHASISAMLLSLGINIDSGFLHNVFVMLSLMFGVAGILAKEKGNDCK